MNRNWNILCWNVRGINGQNKWDALRNKIDESSCAVVCLQETKREFFDAPYIRNFAPRRLDTFDYIPSVESSGGILVLWNSTIFKGVVLEKRQFSLTLSLTSQHNHETWFLSSVYGPCTEPGRSLFIEWMKNLQIGDDENWLLVGDFNFYRSLEDRNRLGGNIQDTFIFNEVTGQLGLIELPLKGRAFTWSNMQQDPLLEQLDWFFTSVNWTSTYPITNSSYV